MTTLFLAELLCVVPALCVGAIEVAVVTKNLPAFIAVARPLAFAILAEETLLRNRLGSEPFKSEDPKRSPRVIRLDCLVLSTDIWLAAAALPVGGTLLYWPEEVYCCAFAAPELAANAAARLALTKVLYKNPNISL